MRDLHRYSGVLIHVHLWLRVRHDIGSYLDLKSIKHRKFNFTFIRWWKRRIILARQSSFPLTLRLFKHPNESIHLNLKGIWQKTSYRAHKQPKTFTMRIMLRAFGITGRSFLHILHQFHLESYLEQYSVRITFGWVNFLKLYGESSRRRQKFLCVIEQGFLCQFNGKKPTSDLSRIVLLMG